MTDDSTRSKGRVLIVEDEEDYSATLASNLKHLGYECFRVAQGQEALALLEKLHRESPQGPPVDVILSDLSMPVMDGKKLLTAVRSGEFRDLTFVLISGFISRAELQEYITWDVDGVLLKPSNAKAISDELELAMMRRETKNLSRRKIE